MKNTNDSVITYKTNAPAPWQLTGSGCLLLLKDVPENEMFLGNDLIGQKGNGMGILMIVDYEESDVGPYQEILYIPGRFKFKDIGDFWTISKIYVSTMASVINGRKNWGIPKEEASFAFSGTKSLFEHKDTYRVNIGADTIVELKTHSNFLPIPVWTGLIPSGMRTLAQNLEGQRFRYSPSASGWVHFSTVDDFRVSGPGFPNLTRENIMAAFKVSQFQMTFPESVMG